MRVGLLMMMPLLQTNRWERGVTLWEEVLMNEDIEGDHKYDGSSSSVSGAADSSS